MGGGQENKEIIQAKKMKKHLDRTEERWRGVEGQEIEEFVENEENEEIL